MNGNTQILAPPHVSDTETLVRRRWRIAGRVQGVGFRPFIYRLAMQMHVHGAVWNDDAGVVVEGQGTRRQLEEFAIAIWAQAPAPAVIREIDEQEVLLRSGEPKFEIHQSSSAAKGTAEIAADLAVCPQCLAEIRDAANRRRHGYALTNCTNCGPRFSIIRAIPYDRPNTTMARFVMCRQCHEEYENPADRRFHAQPTACRQCGPRLELVDSSGLPIAGDPVEQAAGRLARGEIVAIKGIGGFHLAVRADDQEAVGRLRRLKHRPAKPFALMCASLEAMKKLVTLGQSGAELASSPAAPIVLARRVHGAPIADAVAPGSHRLGVMLAYTPLHHLIFDAIGAFDVPALVMTSGNDVDEPLVYSDAEAVSRLGGMANAVLRHNRPIQRAVDDSVILDAVPSPIFVRRSRGYVPEPLLLPKACSPTPGLAVGAELKSTVATCRDRQAVLSQHLGNLTQASTFTAFTRAISDLFDLVGMTPKWIAHDLHPAYLSTQHAKKLARQWGVPLIPVQHHHAHAAGVLAEQAIDGPALAVICDGTGYGTDGGIWGGELMAVELTDFRRLGRLRPMRLPGGDVAARQPWRSALALLYAAFGDDFNELPICRELADKTQVEFVRQMLVSGAGCVDSSSTGRVFDGIAALLEICKENRFDAEAPAALESAAAQFVRSPLIADDGFTICQGGGLIEIDLSPFVRKIARDEAKNVPAGHWALLFHETLAAAWAAAVGMAAQATGLNDVVLSGGVFCNELFSDLLGQRLEGQGFRVLRHKQVPPNDGGIAFGQAVVAAGRLGKGLLSQPR
ncbi:MAG: carbamoyltransferase HypF [Tepidisphaeraceae bacterium]|jgi:hydrogenase maturation protein HypF